MISIIIINYFQKDYLLKCLESVFTNIKHSEYEVIIINNSPAENLNDIASRFIGVQIIENDNKGFSQANNLAVKKAKGEYLLFLNADTEILSDFSEDLFENFKNVKFGAIGLGLQFSDGRFQNSFGLFPTIINEYKNRKTELGFKNNNEKLTNARKKYYSEIKKTDWVTGAALLVRKKIFDLIGGFDEQFFLYYEDIDLCKRLNDAGYNNYYYPYSKIIHHKGEFLRTSENSKLKKIQQKSQELYYKKHCSLPDRLLLKTYHIVK